MDHMWHFHTYIPVRFDEKQGQSSYEKMMDQMWHFREWNFLYKKALFYLLFVNEFMCMKMSHMVHRRTSSCWLLQIFTSRINGRGNTFGSVCLSVCLSICTLQAEPLDLWTYGPKIYVTLPMVDRAAWLQLSSPRVLHQQYCFLHVYFKHQYRYQPITFDEEHSHLSVSPSIWKKRANFQCTTGTQHIEGLL